ncbi:PROTEIN T03F1.12 [Ceraceosorus bombacis]|uniref:PROTEIN T03F1.12 n=1 Tax=Ceraceosorus bombacis TaxID=401625 RepID=A0A0P1BCM8_9BASI|nr:PROTEIN T03F1.12 [Ceraceosorus bombacis]
MSSIANHQLTSDACLPSPSSPQIIAFQTMHYFILALLIPLSLSLFASRDALTFQGGAFSVSAVLDWRELLGAKSFGASPDWADAWLTPVSLDGVPGAGGLQHVPLEQITRPAPGRSASPAIRPIKAQDLGDEWELRAADPSRKWATWLAWIVAGVLDMHLLLFLIRKPTAMLDHVLTFHLLHLIITTLWVRSVPSWWYYALAALHAAGCVVSSEAFAVKREMRDGFNTPVDTSQVGATSSSRASRQPSFVVDEDDTDDTSQTLFEAPSHVVASNEDEKGLEHMELKPINRRD